MDKCFKSNKLDIAKLDGRLVDDCELISQGYFLLSIIMTKHLILVKKDAGAKCHCLNFITRDGLIERSPFFLFPY